LVGLLLLLLPAFDDGDGWLFAMDCAGGAAAYAAELVVALTGGMTRPVR
jgi:hypothetical protein